jgi:hypothetical protein
LAVFGIVVGFGIDTRRLDIASIQGGFPPFTYQYIQSGNLRIFICSDYGWSWIN